MKKHKSIKIFITLLFILCGIAMLSFGNITYNKENTIQTIKTLNNYNYDVRNVATANIANVQARASSTNWDELGMGPQEKIYPDIGVKITMAEGENIIDSSTTYPIIKNTKIKVKIEITNHSVEKSVKNMQLVGYSGGNGYINHKEIESPIVNLQPEETYTINKTITINDENLQFHVTGDNIEEYESEIYSFALFNNRENKNDYVKVVNIEHKLTENPEGIVYEDDTIKGEIAFYSEVEIGGEPEYGGKKEDERIERKYTDLKISMHLPSGVTIKNLKYKDSSRSYSSSREGIIDISKSNNFIEVTLYKMPANERGYITFDYTINKGCKNFSIGANAKISSQWKFEYSRYEESRYHQEHCPGAVNGWHVEDDEYITEKYYSSSERFSYIIGHPNIKVTQKAPYVYEDESSNELIEQKLLAYEFEVENTGNAPAVLFKLTQKVNPDLGIWKVEAENKDSLVPIGFIVKDGLVTINIGRLNNGDKITVRIIVNPRALTKNEQTMTLSNQVTVEAKKVDPITTKKQDYTVKRDENITKVDEKTKEERDRLQESYTLCNALGEVYLRDADRAHGNWCLYTSGGNPENYCVEPGGAAKIRKWHGEIITHSMVSSWVSGDPTEKSRCGCADDVEHYRIRSSTHWQCVKRHYTESSSHYVNPATGVSRSNLYDIGFILSWTQKWNHEIYSNNWSQEQQQAIWQSDINEAGSNGFTYAKAEGKRLLQVATNYKDFYEKIMDTSSEQEEGMKPKSLIEYETSEDENTGKTRMEVSVDQTEGLAKIGPFKLDYIDGSYTTDGIQYSFGGISDMYLLDENNNRINITNIVKEDGAGTGNASVYKVEYPKSENSGANTFFSIYEPGTSNTDGNTMDWNDATKTYPKPEEEFYIEISTKYDFNQDGTIDANDYIPAALKLKAEFSYMRSTASICIRNGKYYYESQITHHGRHHHPGDEDHHSYYDHGNCTKDPTFAQNSDDQDVAFVLYQNREIKKQELTIPIGNGDYITTTMKIGGFVFQDQLQGKENNYDGKKLENDLNLKNIEVALYDAETDELVNLRTLKSERPDVKDENGNITKEGATQEQINDANDYTRRTNPTLTDASGYYEFRGVSIGKKYYVKFIYNGQTYLPTEYMQDCDITKLNEEDNTYGASDNWRQSSKGTEKQSDRTAFDKVFESIGSSPNNYVSKNTLGHLEIKAKNGFYNETYSHYELAGFYLDSDGNYQQNEENQLVDTYIQLQEENGHNFMVDTSDSQYEEEPILKEGLISKAIKNYIDNKDIDGNQISGQYENLQHLYPTDEVMKNYIYQQVVDKVAKRDSEKETLWKKLQFIEDCQISSYTKSITGEETAEFDTYPYPDYYTIFVESGQMYPNNSYELTSDAGSDNQNYDNRGTYADNLSVYTNKSYNVNGPTNKVKKDGTPEVGKGRITYINVYPGQLFINQGLIVRQDADISLRKDVYKTTLLVNGKTEVYEYNTRKYLSQEEKNKLKELRAAYEANRTDSNAYLAYINYKEELEQRYWEIQGKIIDYTDYYGEAYNRELYESDYYFPGDINGNNQLEAYVTYKITIRNQSESILTRIDEVVDYYDETYEFQADKSWMMYGEPGTYMEQATTSKDNYTKYITVPDQDFYDIMTEDLEVGQKVDGIDKYREISYTQNKNGATRSNADFDEEFAQEGYETIYINSLNKTKMQSGEEVYLYLTFKVEGKGGENADLKIEGGPTEEGKQNIVEINGYSTYYKDGTQLPNGITIKGENTTAGKIDTDSDPGNFRAENLKADDKNRYEQNFEDDTDRARGIRVFIAGPEDKPNDPDNPEEYMIRKVSGTAWEDKRDTEVADAVIGNGIREKGELTIENIRVQLLEVILDEEGRPSVDNNGDLVTRIAQIYAGDGNFREANTITDANGKYQFEGIVPGDYIVRFTYGGEYNAYYNGQDYKTTSYQVGINQSGRTDVTKEEKPGYNGYTNIGNYDDSGSNYGQNASGSYGYDIQKADRNQTGNVSDAKDLWRCRAKVNNYSSNGYNSVTYDLANTLNKNKEANANTQMIAETGVIRAEFEYNRENTNANTKVEDDGTIHIIDNNGYKGTSTGRDSYTGQNNTGSNNQNGTYHIQNVDLGLEERPKAQLELDKKLINVKLVLANQNILFDAIAQANNVQWEDKTLYNIYKSRTEENNKIYKYYNTYDQFRKDEIEKTVTDLVNKEKGLITLTMDEELMHGATIQLTYDMFVTNVGEVDYKETQFYYNGITQGVKNPENIVTTSADVVLDYVSNNLKYRAVDNNASWSDVTKQVKNGQYELNFDGKGPANTERILNLYNTIIETKQVNNEELGLSKALIPAKTTKSNAKEITNKDESQTQTRLVLSQLITAQDTQDDKCYNNISEIVKISNDVGRRMAYSVQGNQDPTVVKLNNGTAKLELDSSMAEQVKILPPFGIGNIVVYVTLAVGVLAILTTGIIIIKKKVLNK